MTEKGYKMGNRGLSLGKIFNIPIFLDYSWFLIFALITWSLAVNYYPLQFSNWTSAEYWIVGAITAIMLFVSVLLHEIGHSLVATHYQIKVSSITLMVFGGVSQITKEPNSAIQEFWISVVGPLVSFVLAGIFFLLTLVTKAVPPLWAVIQYLVYINLILGIFNLIPGFPLDGGNVFRAIVWGISHNFRRATRIAATVGRILAFLMILFGVYEIFLGNLVNGLWIAFIGWFLESAANAQLNQQHIHDLLQGHTVVQAMGKNFVILPADMTLQKVADDHVLEAGRRFFIIEKGGFPLGILTLSNLKEVPRSEWPIKTTAQAMTPIEKVHTLKPDSALSDAFDEMTMEGERYLPVIVDGQVEGILSNESLLNFLRTIQEMTKGTS
jgi:Zn-dependent protease/CBS domain-containing protein